MKGLPVTIRLLDPPLHEFLPHTQAEIEEVARAMNTDPRKLADRARELAEFNPMLGFRGCRLAIAYPEIAEMQARAIFEAAVEAEKRTGKAVGLEVMVPLIATKAEFDLVKARIDATAKAVMKETGKKLNYQVGTMIELPRACLMAGRDRRDRRILLLRHQRSDADHLRHQPRRRGELPRHLRRQGHSGDRSVHLGRSRRRRRARQDRRRSAAARRGLISRSASAASMAAIPLPSHSATRSGSTTSPARPTACRSPASPPRKPRSARRSRARRKDAVTLLRRRIAVSEAKQSMSACRRMLWICSGGAMCCRRRMTVELRTAPQFLHHFH